MNKKLYISLLFSLSVSCIANAMDDVSAGKKVLTPPSTITSSASAFSLYSLKECSLDRSSVDSGQFSPAIVEAARVAGVLPKQYGFFVETIQAAASGRRTLAQALADQHAAEDASKAAPRLAFAKEVRASKLFAKKATQDARDSEEAIAAAQKEIVGCLVS